MASVSNADDLRASKAKLHLPLYLIVHSGGDFDIAIEQIALFRNRHPDARIAIVADQYRLNELTSAFRAGANGYFANVITRDRFIKSIELVMMGETIFPLEYLSAIIDANRPHLIEATASDRNGEKIAFPTEDATAPLLSPREKEILKCVTEGASNKWIARKINIAEATVKIHVKAILRKIGLQNRIRRQFGAYNRSHTHPEVNGGLCLPSPAEAKITTSIATGHPEKDKPIPAKCVLRTDI